MRNKGRRDRFSFVFLLIILIAIVLLVYLFLINPPHEHSAKGGEWHTDIEPTCTKSGLKYQICTECDAIFADTVIPANGHTPLERKENEIASTCTKGGSYEKVTYCEVCDEELSRETVQVELKPHTRSYSYVVENRVNPTHTTQGTYDHVMYCKVCRTEMERLKKTTAPKGHDYDWELVYDEDDDEFRLIGTCSCEEEGNVFTYVCDPDKDLVLDTSVPTCCRKVYTSKVTIDGVLIKKSVEVEPDSHIAYDTHDVSRKVVIEDYASYDPVWGKYYVVDGELEGIVERLESSEWDENGFAYGAFLCAVCKEENCSVCERAWMIVCIYSSKYDTRISN